MKVLILTGGSLCESASTIIENFRPEHILAADAGLRYALTLGIVPDSLLGDFDSAPAELVQQFSAIPRQTFPPEKDYTDTELALEKAMELAGPNGQILILGGMGTRADHSLANIFLLKKAADAGIECTIADDHNRIRMIKGHGKIVLKRRAKEVISLLPVFGDAKGVTLEGFYYPLADRTIRCGWSLGVSNYLTEDEGTVTIRDGYLLVIRAADGRIEEE